MSNIKVEFKSPASPESVWDLMSDFANIDFFNPNLASSHLMPGSPAHGIGTVRQCNLIDGKNYIRERVTAWNEGQSYTIDIYEGTMPVKDAHTTLGLEPQADGSTRLYMDFHYQPKFGLAGLLMDKVMLNRMMRGMLMKLLHGLSEKATLRDGQRMAA